MYNNRRYIIIPSSEIPNIDFTQVLETSIETLRLSVDGNLTFVKYNVNIVEEDSIETYIDAESGIESTIQHNAGIYGRPDIYSSQYVEYAYEQMLDILNTSTWAKQTSGL